MALGASRVPQLIPTYRRPGLRIAVDRTYAGVASLNPRTLLVAPCETGALLPTGIPALMAAGLSDVQYWAGLGSPMVEAAEAIILANPTTELWIAWAGDGTTKATFTGTISGTTTAAGTMHLYVNGVHHLAIAAATVGDDATDLAQLVEDAVDADASLPVTVDNTAGALTFTAKFGGAPGNNIDIRWNLGGATAGEAAPAGATLPSIVAGTAGATDVSHATLIANIADDQYDHIVLGYNDTTTIGLWRAELRRRWGHNVMKWAWLSVALADSIANIKTWVETNPDWCIQAIGYEAENPCPPWIAAADYGATCEYHRTLGTTGSPHLGCDGYALQTMVATPKGSRFSEANRETLLGYGAATMAFDSTGDALIELEQASDKNPIQMAWITKAWNEYKRTELTSPAYRNKALISDELDDVPEGCIQPKSIKAKYMSMGRIAYKRGWFRDMSTYKAGLFVAPVEGDPDALEILETPNYAGQLRRLNDVLQFRHLAT